jgi:hypothetical protein
LISAEDELRDHLESIKDLEEKGVDAYEELREIAETTILDALQE